MPINGFVAINRSIHRTSETKHGGSAIIIRKCASRTVELLLNIMAHPTVVFPSISNHHPPHRPIIVDISAEMLKIMPNDGPSKLNTDTAVQLVCSFRSLGTERNTDATAVSSH